MDDIGFDGRAANIRRIEPEPFYLYRVKGEKLDTRVMDEDGRHRSIEAI